MAIPAQGLAFTWGTSTLLEIQEFEISPLMEVVTFSGETLSRSRGGSTITLRRIRGSLTLLGFSTAGLEQNKIRLAYPMKITVPVSESQRQVLWDGWAQYQASTIRGSANGVILFAFQFTLFGVRQTVGTLESI